MGSIQRPIMGFSGAASGEEPTCKCRRRKRYGFDPWVGKIPWRRAWQPTPVFLRGESPWTEVGYSPQTRIVGNDCSDLACTSHLVSSIQSSCFASILLLYFPLYYLQMTRVNVDILGISELRWTGMGEFNSDDHYIYYCGQESLRRNGVAVIVNKRV